MERDPLTRGRRNRDAAGVSGRSVSVPQVADADLVRPLGESGLDDSAAWMVLDANPDGLVVCDEHGTIVFVNGQLETMSGYDRVELLGQSVEMLVPSDRRGSHRSHRLGYQANPTARAMGEERELALLRRDGLEVPVEISLAPVMFHATVLTAVGVRDVTSRRAADRARRRLLNIIDQLPGAVFVCRSATETFEYVNTGATTLLGYPRERLSQMALRDVVPGLVESEDPLDLAPSGPIDSVAGVDMAVRDHTGADIPCEVRVVRTVEAGDHVYVVVAQDARERLEWAKRLEASEEAFRSAFEQAPVGMLVTEIASDETRRVIRANRSFIEFLGTSEEDFLGLSPAEFTHPDDDVADRAATAAQLSGDAPTYMLEKRYRRRDGSYVWGELHSSLLGDVRTPDDAGQPVHARLSHVIDITERRAEQDRLRRVEQAERSINELSVALFADADHDAVLHQALIDIVEIVGASGGVIVMHERIGAGTRLVARHGRFPAEPDETRDDESALHMASDTPDEPRLVKELRNGSGVTGWIALRRPPGDPPFSDTDTDLAVSHAGRVATLLELAKARAAQQRLEVLEDRDRIARDLHDTVIQDLFAVGMQINAAAQRIPDHSLTQKFESYCDQIDVAIRRLRGAIFDLHEPATADDRHALTTTLASTLAESARVLGHHPNLRLVGPVDDLPDRVVRQMLPTLREALSNVARHARASMTDITITADARAVTLEVEDDGVGISPTAQLGSGTSNVRHRAEALGGTATMTNRLAGGCRLEWTVPLTAP